MDLFDFVPLIPPDLPGERSPERSAGHRFTAGIGSTLFPTVNFLLVLFAAFASHITVALAAMPLASGTLLYVLGRRLALTVSWAIALAMGCAAFCVVGNGCALFLRGLMQFFKDF